MPRYDYKCKNCNKDFFIVTGINDSRNDVTCNYCQSKNIARIFNAVVLKGSSLKEKPKNANEVISEDKSQKTNHEHKYGEQCSPEEDYI